MQCLTKIGIKHNLSSLRFNELFTDGKPQYSTLIFRIKPFVFKTVLWLSRTNAARTWLLAYAFS